MTEQITLDILNAAKPNNVQRLAAFCKKQYSFPIMPVPVNVRVLWSGLSVQTREKGL
jgi:hypothetical protein